MKKLIAQMAINNKNIDLVFESEVEHRQNREIWKGQCVCQYGENGRENQHLCQRKMTF